MQCGSEACAEFLLSETAATALAPGASGSNKPLVDPNRPGGAEQERPLNSAARRGRLPFVFLLLRAGADPAATDYDGETVVHAAARCGQVGVIEELASQAPQTTAAGARKKDGDEEDGGTEDDDNSSNKNNGGGSSISGGAVDNRGILLPQWWCMLTDVGETATFAAAAEGHAGVLRALRAIGSLEPSRPNAEGVTPMVAAALAGHSEVGAENFCAVNGRVNY